MLNKILRGLFTAAFITLAMVGAYQGQLLVGVVCGVLALFLAMYENLEMIPKDLGEESDEEEES